MKLKISSTMAFQIALALVVACNSGGSTPPPPAPTTPSTEAPPTRQEVVIGQAPIALFAQGPERIDGETVEVVVRLQRQPNVTAPVTLTAHVPGGATLASGAPSEIVADTSLIAERRFVLKISRPPVEDFMVTADLSVPGAGAHATVYYRFGRPEPKLPQPQGPGMTPSGLKLPPR